MGEGYKNAQLHGETVNVKIQLFDKDKAVMMGATPLQINEELLGQVIIMVTTSLQIVRNCFIVFFCIFEQLL